MEMIEKIFTTEYFDNFANIKRWNTKVTTRTENLAEHSFYVSLFTMFLSEIVADNYTKLDILRYSILHDADELFTGDIGHELKYNKFNGEELTKGIRDFVEYFVKENFKGDQFELFAHNVTGKIDFRVKKIVKLADWLSMVLFLNRQIKISTELIAEYSYCIDCTLTHCNELFDLILKDSCGFFKQSSTNSKHAILNIMNFIKSLKEDKQ